MGLRLGEKLGNYHLLRLLGQGAFAEVYLGEHRYLRSYAALKLLRASLTDEGAQRFLSEAQRLVQLRHPHIVRVLEFFVEGSRPVLVMDYAPQGTLRQRYPSGERLPLSTTVTLVQQAAAALQYAHNRHLIHRDIKPENMLLDAEENLLLSDFGLALFVPSMRSLSTQQMAGTVAYSAPEQLRGKPVFASDQYALAVMTYEWLCGVRPFVGGFWDVVSQHQLATPAPLRLMRPELPPAVETVVLRALSKTPQERFVSVEAYAVALQRATEERTAGQLDNEGDTAPRKAVFPSASMMSPSPTDKSLHKLFLAASPLDKALLNRLCSDLGKRGISIINGVQNVSTDATQPSLRMADRLLVLVTAHTRSSASVREQIAMAMRERKCVVFFWAEGEDMAALLLDEQNKGTSIDVVDARHGRYWTALEDLVAWMGEASSLSQVPTIPSAQPLPGSAIPQEQSGPHPSVLAPDKSNKQKRKRLQSREASSNRQRMLSKVRAFWITGVLEQSLHGAALMTLGLQAKSDAVISPWRLVLEQPGAAERPLPSGTIITQVYDAAGGELLLLGEPGSGKTTLLLQLTRDLLDRAEIDESRPLPVVFNLSSWAEHRQPLTAWLVEELNTKYQVPRKIGQQWVATDVILPLLDGLDEVVPQYRAACVEAINAYRQEHGLLPTVVCSRTADYLALKERILLRDAVTVQPLTSEQIDEYLWSMGEQVTAVRVALHQDAELRELMATPLMLSIVTLAYHGTSVDDLLTASSLDERRQHIFNAYVERMLQRRGANTRYTPQQTIHWLKWLAQQMVQRSQTVFYIERMQPDWLPTERLLRLHPRLVVGLVFGTIFGLIFSLIFGMYVWPSFFFIWETLGIWSLFWATLGLGLICGLLFGLLNGLLSLPERKERVVSEAAKRRRGITHGVLKVVLNVLLMEVLFAGIYLLSYYLHSYYLSLYNEYLYKTEHATVASMVLDVRPLGVVLPFGVVLFLVISGLVGKLTERIQPAEVLAWSWTNMGWGFLKFLLIGLWGGVLIPLLYQVVFDLFTGQFSEPDPIGIALRMLNTIVTSGSLYIAAASGILSGFLGGLTGGLSSRTIDESNLVKPNQGMRQSVRNGLIVSLIVLLAFVIITYALLIINQVVTERPLPDISTLLLPSSSTLMGILSVGLIIGLIAGIRSGGAAYIQHVLLRVLLWKSQCIPRNYTRFLDHASAHILLRKVGGGYIFVHRLLLEYFAPPDAMLASDTQPLPAQQAFSLSQRETTANLLAASHAAVSLSTKNERPGVERRTVLLSVTGITGFIGLGGFVSGLLLPRPPYISSRDDSSREVIEMWSPDGKYIANRTYTSPEVAQIWNASDGHLVYTYAGLMNNDKSLVMVWSPVDNRIAWVNSEGMVQILDITNGFHLLTYPQGEHPASSVAWSPDGKHVAVGYENGVAQIRSTAQTAHDPVYQLLPTGQDSVRIHSIAWSPDGKHLASFSDNGTMTIWDTLSGEPMQTFTAYTRMMITWSPNGQYLVWMEESDGAMIIWSVAEESRLSSYKIKNDSIRAIAWAPDSKYMALGSEQGIVQVWDVMNRRVVYTYRKHGGSVYRVGWSLDGYIALMSTDGTIQVWDALKGDLVRFYWTPSGSDWVDHVEWSPDGKRITSSRTDGSIQLWQVF